MAVGDEDTGVVKHRGTGDHLVAYYFHRVLDGVHGRHVDHHLRILLVIGRVKQVDVLPVHIT